MSPAGHRPPDTHGRGQGGHVLLVGTSGAFVDRAAAAVTRHAPALTLSTASDVDAALASLSSVDCLLVAASLDPWTRTGVVEAVRERAPALPVVVVGDAADPDDVDAMFAGGATDVVAPDAPDALLAARLETAVTVARSRRADAADDDVNDDAETLGELKQRALDGAALGVVIAEAAEDTPTVFANEGFGRLTGYDPEALVGGNCRILQGPDTEEGPVREMRDALAAAEPVSVVLRNYRADGTPFWNEVEIEPVTDDGTVTHYLGFQRDVTERVTLRTELEAAQEALRGLYRVTTDASLSLDERIERTLALACDRLDVDLGFVTRVVDDHQHIVHAVGDHPLLQPGETCPLSESYCRRTLDGEGLLAVVHAAAEAEWADDPSYARFGLEAYFGGRVSVDGDLYGTLCFADTDPRTEPFTEAQTAFVELLTRWVSYELERQRREQDLRTATRRFQALFEDPLTFAGVLDPDGTLREANDTARSTLADPDSALGQPLWETPWWGPDEDAVETVRDAVATAASGEAAPFECAYFHESGSGTVSATIYPVYGASDDPSCDAADTGIVSLVAVGTDTTTRTQQAEQLRRQRDRLEEFASVVSHDLRSPLEVARGRLHLYETTDDPEHLAQAKGSLDRMAALVDDLLDLARQGEAVSDPVATPVVSVAHRAWSTVSTDAATLAVDLDPEFTVDADPSRLRQLFENLFRNAVEHGSTDSRVPPDAAIEHGSTDSRSRPGAGDRVSVRLVGLDGRRGFAVEDDGVGIDPDEREQVFERGFSTNADGTGFGLAIVERVVDAHGWRVGVTESAAGGARFEVSFEDGDALPETAS